MKVLVTGAGGFSGAEITRALLMQGHRVIAVCGSSRGRLTAEAEKLGDITVISGDLAANLPLPAADAVVHAAARSPAPGVTADKMVRDNILATRRLIEHAKTHRVGKLLFLSSLSVYGRIETPVVDEKTAVRDPETYGLSKLVCEKLLAEAGGFSGLAIRLPGVLGRDSVRHWLTGVLQAAREGREIVIYNPDAPFNNAVHVADLGRFVGELLRRDWRGFDAVTIGAAGHTTVRNAVKMIVAAFGDRSTIREEHLSRQSFSVSSARATSLYGYDPMEIEAMLRRFAAENPASNA